MKTRVPVREKTLQRKEARGERRKESRMRARVIERKRGGIVFFVLSPHNNREAKLLKRGSARLKKVKREGFQGAEWAVLATFRPKKVPLYHADVSNRRGKKKIGGHRVLERDPRGRYNREGDIGKEHQRTGGKGLEGSTAEAAESYRVEIASKRGSGLPKNPRTTLGKFSWKRDKHGSKVSMRGGAGETGPNEETSLV